MGKMDYYRDVAERKQSENGGVCRDYAQCSVAMCSKIAAPLSGTGRHTVGDCFCEGARSGFTTLLFFIAFRCISDEAFIFDALKLQRFSQAFNFLRCFYTESEHLFAFGQVDRWLQRLKRLLEGRESMPPKACFAGLELACLTESKKQTPESLTKTSCNLMISSGFFWYLVISYDFVLYTTHSFSDIL